MSNKYLIQALREFEITVQGQFDQESRYECQITQDAANEIERLNKQIQELKEDLTYLSVKYEPKP